MTLAQALHKKMGCPHCGTGMTIRETGRKSGLGHNAIFRALSGKPLTAKSTIKLCVWVGVDPRKVELP